jgi:hypothetical protein
MQKTNAGITDVSFFHKSVCEPVDQIAILGVNHLLSTIRLGHRFNSLSVIKNAVTYCCDAMCLGGHHNVQQFRIAQTHSFVSHKKLDASLQ